MLLHAPPRLVKAVPSPPRDSSVRVMLARLERKGFLRHRQEGLRYVYSATVSPTRAKRAALRALAGSLTNHVGRPVVDCTEASGEFDLDLSWTPEQSDPSAPGSRFSALQEQLGLTLEPQLIRETVRVVESVERPIED